MTAGRGLVQFDRTRIAYLLERLDARLLARGVTASVYVVGGAAIALTVHDSRRTQDVDALVSDTSVFEEAAGLADDEMIPVSWLNDHARAWVPPLPDEVDLSAGKPGLTVYTAPPEHLMAMKLVSMRRQDVPDLVALAVELEMISAPPQAFVALLLRTYGGADALQQVLGVPYEDVEFEAALRGEALIRVLVGAGLREPDEDS